jgi:hypothetical protein
MLLAVSVMATASDVHIDSTEPTLRFTANKGQWNPEAKYLAHKPGFDVWVTDSGVTYDFYRTKGGSLLPTPGKPFPKTDVRRSGHVVKVAFEGSSAQSHAQADGLQPSVMHYLRREKSARFVPNYSSAEVKGLYPGIDMRMYADPVTGDPRFDIVLAPGADVRKLKMRYDGAKRVRIDQRGRVAFDTALGTVVERGLYAYEYGADGVRSQVAVKPYLESGTVRYQAASRDPSKTLVIDPLVSSTRLGYSEQDQMADILVEPDGEQVVVGLSVSPEYPTTTGAYDDWEQNMDGVVTKLNADGSNLVWSTFLGGADVDVIHSIVADSLGRLVLSGYTASADFPTVSALDPIGKGGTEGIPFDVFLCKMSPNGSSLIFSTYFASSGPDISFGLALDANSRIYISGLTQGADLPVKNAYQGRYNGMGDGFVASFSGDGQNLRFCTYLGGTGGEILYDVAVDGQGRSVVVGTTGSTNFPTRYAFQRNLAGPSDAFVSMLDATGKNLLFSTYFGGDKPDSLLTVGLDSTGRIIASGLSDGGTVPVSRTIGTVKSTNGLLLGITPTWQRSFATLLGGLECYHGFSIAADDRITISGVDQESDIPATAGAYQYVSAGNSDGFVMRLNKNASAITYFTRFGGREIDVMHDGMYGPTGVWYGIGWTSSPDLPTTPSAFDKSPDLQEDGFVSQISLLAGKVIIDPVKFDSGDADTNITLRIPTPVAGSTTINLSGGGGILQLPTSATIVGGSTSVTISVPLSYTAADAGKVVRFTASRGGSNAQRLVVVPAP